MAEIIATVRADGDAALLALSERFDGVNLSAVRVSDADIQAALDGLSPELRRHLTDAAASIAAYHRSQLREPTEWVNPDTGVKVTSRDSPVRRAGCYAPGGLAAYPSTVLMTAVVARTAGVQSVVLCSPADAAHGGVAPVTLAAAAIAGVDEVYAVGGAQAIAAMAFGTASLAPVDVVCGPGNRFVAIAKQQVAGQVGIAAAFAGPSEVVVVADSTMPAAYAAVDLMAQAEHGGDGLAWLVSWDKKFLDSVAAEVASRVVDHPRAEAIRSTLASGGIAVLVEDPQQALEVVNFIAPEHLQLCCADAADMAVAVRNAGAVFCGPWGSAALGDYAAGPSHVLPTHGSARFASALGVEDFVRRHHVVDVDEAAFRALASTVEGLADAEGLTAHGDAVRVRLAGLDAATNSESR